MSYFFEFVVYDSTRRDTVCLQEELAFMFEMLTLYEDALVQYDELDALFTQFVLNHAAGGNRGVGVRSSVVAR